MKMTLELSLVQTQNVYGNFYELLDRERVIIDNGDEDALPAVIKFLNKNIDYVDSYVTDKSIVAQIRNMSTIDVTGFACLRYMLGTYGLDVLLYVVADQEDNADGLSTGIIEYNVIDMNDYMTPSIPFATKFTMDADRVSLPALYQKVNEIFELFKGDLFADFGNPITQYCNVLETSERLSGIVMGSVTNLVNNIFNYLGIKITVITNSTPVEI